MSQVQETPKQQCRSEAEVIRKRERDIHALEKRVIPILASPDKLRIFMSGLEKQAATSSVSKRELDLMQTIVQRMGVTKTALKRF